MAPSDEQDELRDAEPHDMDEEEMLDPDVPIDFATFVLSLSSSAAFHLGMVPRPEKNARCHNLPMAKQTIDILSILQIKTKGNLTGEEERLLGEIIYNLRMAYVREAARCQCGSHEP